MTHVSDGRLRYKGEVQPPLGEVERREQWSGDREEQEEEVVVCERGWGRGGCFSAGCWRAGFI